MTFNDKAAEAVNPAAKRLFELCYQKKSTIWLADDDFDFDNFLPLIERVGEEIVVLKTHMDLLEYPDVNVVENIIKGLVKLADRFGFLIFEDRKFADIGKIVKRQYTHGVFNIVKWAHFVNAHSLPGPGIIKGLHEAAQPFIDKGELRGLIMLAHMTPKGHLFTEKYAEDTITMSEEDPEFVAGYVAGGSDPDAVRDWIAAKADPSSLIATPGIKFDVDDHILDQQYSTPDVVIGSGSDGAIIGSGIYEANDPAAEAAKYRKVCWDTYESIRRQS